MEKLSFHFCHSVVLLLRLFQNKVRNQSARANSMQSWCCSLLQGCKSGCWVVIHKSQHPLGYKAGSFFIHFSVIYSTYLIQMDCCIFFKKIKTKQPDQTTKSLYSPCQYPSTKGLFWNHTEGIFFFLIFLNDMYYIRRRSRGTKGFLLD